MSVAREPQLGQRTRDPTVLRDPPIARLLFSDTRLAWLWLPLRLFLGWQWLQSGLQKVANPAWMQGGTALQGFWERAVQVPEPPGRPPIAFDWYREFILFLLQGGHYTWFAPLISFAELAVGVALILGAFTGLAAFVGAFMNWNFIMAGTASTNALLFVIAIGLMLAWKTAGWIGLDRWLLPLLGTPWQRGDLFESRPAPPSMERDTVQYTPQPGDGDDTRHTAH